MVIGDGALSTVDDEIVQLVFVLHQLDGRFIRFVAAWTDVLENVEKMKELRKILVANHSGSHVHLCDRRPLGRIQSRLGSSLLSGFTLMFGGWRGRNQVHLH